MMVFKTEASRKAAGFILAAVSRADLGGVFFPDGEVSYRQLLRLWAERGGNPDVLSLVCTALAKAKKIAVHEEPDGPVLTHHDPDSMRGGGYFDELNPLTTSREEATFVPRPLPKGMGGSSNYDFDVFDSFAIEGGMLQQKGVAGHLARLFGE